MKAIYKGVLFSVIDDNWDGVYLERGDREHLIFVDLSDPDLILDPTDDEVDNVKKYK